MLKGLANSTENNEISNKTEFNNSISLVDEQKSNETLTNSNSTDNISENTQNDSNDELPYSFSFFKMTSFSEIKRKISVYHKFYSNYVNNLYNHMTSNQDLKNLTIFIVTIIGILGVFLFKGN